MTVFLGSNVPSVEEDIKRRTRLAAWAFERLQRTIWTNQDITRPLKVRIYQSIILPIATYGSETWVLRKSDCQKLEAFEMRCLRSILGVNFLDKIRNDDIRQRLNTTSTITEVVSRRRLKWFGHVVRMPQHRLPYQAYTQDFSRRRSPGRPPTRWKDQIPKDTGLDLRQAECRAKDRPEWRSTTCEGARGHPSYADKSSKSCSPKYHCHDTVPILHFKIALVVATCP